MFFTQDDYKKIQQWLIKNSVKDTEFNEANIPFNGEEIITIVQGNQNKKVFLKDLVNQVFNLGISDFVNITDKYDAPNISLEEAIRLIPSRARKEGQVITFLNKEDGWNIYQFKGALNQWNVLDTWEDLFDWEKLIIDSILPDEEDLTKSPADTNGNSYLSLKDREYNPNEFSGLGRVILRKNIMEAEDPIYGKVKKNILYQDMFTQSNTIYEIRYDFNLNGGEITIPEGCILDFQGGSFSNGTIIGDNTNILYNGVIFYNIIIKGLWNVPIISSFMFANPTNLNVIKNVLALQNNDIHNEINIEKANSNYLISLGDDVDMNIIGSNTTLNLYGNVNIISNNSPAYRIFSLYGKNIKVCGSGKIIGDKDTHTYTEGTSHEQGHGIFISKGSSNVVIEGIEVYNCIGDGISQRSSCKDIIIRNVDIHDCGRQGITIQGVKNILVENFNIYNIGGALPESAIDIEPNKGENATCSGIIIKNGHISNCRYGVINSNTTSPEEDRIYKNITLSNIDISDVSYAGIVFEYAEGVVVRDCIINRTPYGIVNRCNILIENCVINTIEKGTTASIGIFNSYDYQANINNCNINSDNCVAYPNNIIINNSTLILNQLCYYKGLKDSFWCYINSSNIKCTTISLDSNIGIRNSIIECSYMLLGKECNISYNIIASSRRSEFTSFISFNDATNVGKYFITNNKISVPDRVFRYIILLGENTKSVVYGNDITGYNSTGRYIGPPKGNYIKNFTGFPAFGETSDRPTFDSNIANDDTPIGVCYLDKTLNKPIYWTGTKWVDATGADV